MVIREKEMPIDRWPM